MIASLAVALGANAAIYVLVFALILRPLPYTAPAQLVAVQDTRRTAEGHFLTADEVRTFASASRTLQQTAVYRAGMGRRLTVRLSSVGERVDGLGVSANTFEVLGVNAAIGRTLLPSDAADERLVLLSDGTWRRHFGANPDVVGTIVRVDGDQYEVVGVMPRGFWYPFEGIGFWIPLRQSSGAARTAEATASRELSLVGRMRSSSSLQTVQGEARQYGVEFDRLAGATQPPRLWRAVTLDDAHRASDRSAFFVVQTLLVVVLALACLNASSLALARAVATRRDTAVRLALGASRWQIVTDVLRELSFVVAAAVALSVPLALLLTKQIVMPLGSDAVVDLVLADGLVWRTVGAAAVLGLACVGCCAVLPLLELRRTPIALVLREAGATAGRPVTRVRRALVGIQVVGAATLLLIAATLAREFLSASRWEPVFPVDGLYTLDVRPSGGNTRVLSWSVLESALAAVPGVEGQAASIRFSPQSLVALSTAGTSDELPCLCAAVTSTFFEVTRIPLRAGRLLTSEDAPGTALVVDEHFAERLGGTNVALQTSLRMHRGVEPSVAQIVGVVAAVSLSPASATDVAPPPTVYTRASSDELQRYTVSIRAAATESMLPNLRAAVSVVDPTLSAFDLEAVRHRVELERAPLRWYATLVATLGGLAAILAASGIAGLLVHFVAARRSELGLRLALGATPRGLAMLVVSDAIRLTLWGSAVGVVFGIALLRVVASSTNATLSAALASGASVSFLLVAVAVIASWWPAMLAARTDPRAALDG